jgi:nucleoside-diphosphate-sugar epimerase
MDGEGRNEAMARDGAHVTPTILVTGASGFVGAALAEALHGAARVRTAGRGPQPKAEAHHVVGDLSSATDWRAALAGVSAVVHAAGPAHARFPADELRRGIVDGSAALARQAAEAGVDRFIYISSIRACVSRTIAGPVREDWPADPEDRYGTAKREAELAILAETSLRPVALRPPLVIGAHAKANLARLLRLLDTPLPLPLAGIRIRRSFVSLASLAEAVRLILRRGA